MLGSAGSRSTSALGRARAASTVLFLLAVLLQGVLYASPAFAAIEVTKLGVFSSSNVRAVEALTDGICLVGGGYSGGGGFPVGISYRTANGTIPFTPSQLPAAAYIADYSFPDTTHGWALGTGFAPAIYKTVNAGATWQLGTLSGFTKSFKAIAFPDLTHGWAVGQEGWILTTGNGGASWTKQTSPVIRELKDVVFTDSQNGWAAGDGGVIIHTSNGGGTWSVQSSGVTENLASMEFSSPSRGVVVGDTGVILTTANGGATWTKRTVANIYSTGSIQTDWNDVEWDGSSIYAVGEAGTLAHSDDNGATWTQDKVINIFSDFLGVSFSSSKKGWVTGAGGALYRITRSFPPDTSTVFTKAATGVTSQLYAVDFVDSSYGWAAGDGGTILKTTNGGKSWSRMAAGAMDHMITGIDFTSRQVGFIAANHIGSAASEYHGYIYKTTDGGATWTPQTHPNDGTLVFRIRMRDAANGWIAGDPWRLDQGSAPPPAPYSSILRTASGGASWARHKDSPPDMMRDFAFPGALTGFAVGYRGWNYRTTNGGTDWVQMTSLTGMDRAMGISFTSATNGVVVGDVFATATSPGTIAHTSDGGATWTEPTLPSDKMLRSADNAGSDIWTVGEADTIMHSGNAGKSWGSQVTKTSGVGFWGVSAVSKDLVVAVGSGGTILVGRRPSLSMFAPKTPKKLYRKKAFKISGTFRPLHTKGWTKLFISRRVNGTYRPYKTISARNQGLASGATRYSASFKTPYAGRYRVKAYFTDKDHYPTYSAQRYFTVRKN